MTNKEIVLKAVNYIEENLNEDIDGLRVSQHVCYSLYHFMRLFQSITGFSPKSYIQQRRLTEAIHQLRNSNHRITDIAYDYQFGSPEAFSRAFRKQFGINPSEIRNGYPLSSLNMVTCLTMESIFRSGQVKDSPPELVEFDERILVGLSFFVSDQTKVDNLSTEWSRLMREVDTIAERVMPERYYQMQYWSDKQELGGLYFFTGVEVNRLSGLNPLFVVKTIPAGRYLRFIHRGVSNKVGYTYQYIYTRFLPETNFRLIRPFNFEYYGERYLGPTNEDSESEIYIPIE
jgi:AraC family transcriptional regulator